MASGLQSSSLSHQTSCPSPPSLLPSFPPSFPPSLPPYLITRLGRQHRHELIHPLNHPGIARTKADPPSLPPSSFLLLHCCCRCILFLVSPMPPNEGQSAFLIPISLNQHLPWHGHHGVGDMWEGVERSEKCVCV